MNQDDVAEPSDNTGEMRYVRPVKVMERQKARTIGIMDDWAGDGAEDTSFKLLLKIVAIIISGIFLAYFVTQLIGVSTSMVFILLTAQGALLAYGLYEWYRNPRM